MYTYTRTVYSISLYTVGYCTVGYIIHPLNPLTTDGHAKIIAFHACEDNRMHGT